MGSCLSVKDSHTLVAHRVGRCLLKVPVSPDFTLKAVDELIRTKGERIRNLEPFVLDNSLRETSVASFYGQTIIDKRKIWTELEKTGFKNRIIASFAPGVVNVDERFVLELKSRGTDFTNLFAFTEWAQQSDKDGVPLTFADEIPLGLSKMKELGIFNPIIEVDVACSRTNWNNFSDEQWLSRFEPIIDWVHANLSQSSKVCFNIRDMPISGATQMQRVLKFIRMLGKLPQRKQPFAIMFEDPTGGSSEDEAIRFVLHVRREMDKVGWHPHFLCHFHSGYGLADAVTLETLKVGCNGIWCAVTKEGAQTGHACSVVALTNLARMGCRDVIQNYDMVAIRDAAIQITKIVTGHAPHPSQEVYGRCALEQVFSHTALMRSNNPAHEVFTLDAFFNAMSRQRISNMADTDMILRRLVECFGDFISCQPPQPPQLNNNTHPPPPPQRNPPPPLIPSQTNNIGALESTSGGVITYLRQSVDAEAAPAAAPSVDDCENKIGEPVESSEEGDIEQSQINTAQQATSRAALRAAGERGQLQQRSAAPEWDPELLDGMRMKVFTDGVVGLKCEYSSVLGMSMLLVRSLHRIPPYVLRATARFYRAHSLLREFRAKWVELISHSEAQQQHRSRNMVTDISPQRQEGGTATSTADYPGVGCETCAEGLSELVLHGQEPPPMPFGLFLREWITKHVDEPIYSPERLALWRQQVCQMLGTGASSTPTNLAAVEVAGGPSLQQQRVEAEASSCAEGSEVSECGGCGGTKDGDDYDALLSVPIAYSCVELYLKWALSQFPQEVFSMEDMFHLAIARALTFSVESTLQPVREKSLLNKAISQRFEQFAREASVIVSTL